MREFDIQMANCKLSEEKRFSMINTELIYWIHPVRFSPVIKIGAHPIHIIVAWIVGLPIGVSSPILWRRRKRDRYPNPRHVGHTFLPKNVNHATPSADKVISGQV